MTSFQLQSSGGYVQGKYILCVCPLYNVNGKLIIQQFLQQGIKNWGLLLINDGSNDVITREYNLLKEQYNKEGRIVFLENKTHLGRAHCMNMGLELFHENTLFSHFTWLSCCDQYFTEYLVTIFSSFSANIQFVYTNFYEKLDGIKHAVANDCSYESKEDFLKNYTNIASPIWTRNAVDHIGKFDGSIQGYEGYDYLKRTFTLLPSNEIYYNNTVTMGCFCRQRLQYFKEGDAIEKLAKEKYIDTTIIINSYKPDKTDFLKSIQGCLNQIFVNITIIVSTVENDPTIEFVNELNNPNVKLVISKLSEHPGKGPKGIFFQLNKALREVKTKYFSYFSSNDIIYPSKSYNEIETIKNNESIFCFSRYNSIFPNKKVPFNFSESNMNIDNLMKSNFINDCATIDLSKLSEPLEFNYEKYGNCSYWHLWIKLINKHGIQCMSFNDKIEWDYIRDDKKSQAMQRAVDKNNTELYFNQREFMLSEFNLNLTPQSMYKYSENNEKFWWWNDKTNTRPVIMTVALSPQSMYPQSMYKKYKSTATKNITLLLDTLKNQNNINFSWELIVFEEEGVCKKIIQSYVGKLPECVRIIYKTIRREDAFYKLEDIRKNNINSYYTLLEKWINMARISDDNSKIFVKYTNFRIGPNKLYFYNKIFNNENYVDVSNTFRTDLVKKINLPLLPKNEGLDELYNKVLVCHQNRVFWYNCPSILETSERYQCMYNTIPLCNSSSEEEINELMLHSFNHYFHSSSHIIFFGLYKNREIKILENLNGLNIHIIFGGSDTYEKRGYSVKNMTYLQKIDCNIKYYSISNFINNDLYKWKLNYIPIYLSCLKNKDLFNYDDKIKKKYIYVYDPPSEVYNINLIEKIIQYFGEDLFIRSSKIKVKHSEMPKLLSKCFIGIRLTKHDGNANIVQELGFCGIKCIHNSFFYNSIPFIEDEKSIIKQIENEIENKNKNNYKLVSEIFYNNHKLSNFSLSDIKTNSNRIVDIILWTKNDSEDLLCTCLKSLLFQHLVKTNVTVISYKNDNSKVYIDKYFKEYHNLKHISLEENTGDKNRLILEGLTYIENDYFCVVDVNDIFYTNKINLELESLENKPDNIMCLSDYYLKSNDLKIINVQIDDQSISMCNLMRRSVYEQYIKHINYKNNETLENLLFSNIKNNNNIIKIIKINKALYMKNKI